MSFEKRDNIRPIGVMEKKNMGALKIFASKEMCKTTAAWNTPSFVKNSAKNWKTTRTFTHLDIYDNELKQWSRVLVSFCPMKLNCNALFELSLCYMLFSCTKREYHKNLLLFLNQQIKKRTTQDRKKIK